MKANSGPRRVGAAAATLLALLAAGCGQANNGDTQADTTTSTSSGPNTPTEQATPDPGRTFTANPAIVDAHAMTFDSWSPLAADRVAVNFQIGSPDCFGVDVTTTETSNTVTIALRSGRLPEAQGRMCTMIAVFGTLDVQLKQPLGNRKVLSAQ